MDKSDRQRITMGATLLIFLLIIIVPYVYAGLSSDAEQVFGGFLLNPIDGNSYLAKMQQGWQGQWTFHLPYTAEEDQGVLLFVYYLFLGHLARFFQLPLIFVYHLARILGAILLAAVLSKFIIERTQLIEFGAGLFVLLLLGTGSGWLGLLFGQVTANLWVAEAYPFLSSYTNPHFPLGLAILIILLFYEPGTSARSYVIAGILSFILALVLPFGVVILGVILSLEAMILFFHTRSLSAIKIQLLYLAVLAVGGLPILGYDLLVTWTHPLLAGWNEQNLTPSPPLWDLALALSPALLLAVPAVVRFYTHTERNIRLAILWLAAGLALMYLPFGLQRRMISGLFIPAAILAMIWIAKSIASRRQTLAASLLITLSIPTTVVVILIGLVGVNQRAPEIYVWRAEIDAFAWISVNTPPHALILASPETGLLIPAYTGRKVLYGHPFETVNAMAMEKLVNTLLEEVSRADVTSIPAQVDYVFIGPRETKFLDSSVRLPFPVAYHNDRVIIYEILPAAR